MKSVSDAHIGDTFYEEKISREKVEAFPGYEHPKAMVFAGIYPEDPEEYEELEKSLKKLCLTDGSVSFNYESSAALGSGFRCGFLGMLHLDVFRQRLQDEHEMYAIITAPTVSYKCKVLHQPEIKVVDNPLESPAPELIEFWEEAIV
jgi:GTP-binding protein LepA